MKTTQPGTIRARAVRSATTCIVALPSDSGASYQLCLRRIKEPTNAATPTIRRAGRRATDMLGTRVQGRGTENETDRSWGARRKQGARIPEALEERRRHGGSVQVLGN